MIFPESRIIIESQSSSTSSNKCDDINNVRFFLYSRSHDQSIRRATGSSDDDGSSKSI
jgi:hypothetical protein